METNRSKYDTNPLEPDVEKKAEKTFGTGETGSPTQRVSRNTGQVDQHADARQNLYSEAPTRRYDSNTPLEAPYPSVFVPPTYAPPVQTPPRSNPNQPQGYARPDDFKIEGIGISERWATALAYAPWLGIVVCLLEMFLVPRREAKVRFHASQALAIHIGILVIQRVFDVIGLISHSSLGGSLFTALAVAFLIITMIRVLRGESPRIAPVAEAAQWFNDHIEPRNKG
ncbi:MAG: hypothetical protein C5B55_10370 [Blastocatellia bacterium]|nr:MAG: hypothetical protein C5B55_10370 [Blastocatellia bacterium]